MRTPIELNDPGPVTFRAQADRRQVICVLTGAAERRGAGRAEPSAGPDDDSHAMWPPADQDGIPHCS